MRLVRKFIWPVDLQLQSPNPSQCHPLHIVSSEQPGLYTRVYFLCERKGYLQRHLFCCLLRFQPSPGVWIETVFIPARQSGGFSLALTILPANSKDDGGVSRNCTFRILTSGHCCKIAVDFMFQVFLSFITKLPERERHQHGCWIDKGEVQNVCSRLLIRVKKRTPVTFIMVPDEWTWAYVGDLWKRELPTQVTHCRRDWHTFPTFCQVVVGCLWQAVAEEEGKRATEPWPEFEYCGRTTVTN